LAAPVVLFVAGCATTVAFDVHLEDRRMVDESVDRSDSHAGIRKHVIPSREGLVGRDQKAAALVSFGDQFEQDACFGLVLPRVRQVVKDIRSKRSSLARAEGNCRL